MKDKFDGWLAVAGLELIGLIAGAAGAAVSLFLVARTELDDAKKLTPRGKVVTWLAGTVTAAYAGPLIIDSAGLPAKATAGVIFFVGLGGLSLAEALIKQMPDIIKALRVKYLGG
jgi:hypothetical protein